MSSERRTDQSCEHFVETKRRNANSITKIKAEITNIHQDPLQSCTMLQIGVVIVGGRYAFNVVRGDILGISLNSS